MILQTNAPKTGSQEPEICSKSLKIPNFYGIQNEALEKEAN